MGSEAGQEADRQEALSEPGFLCAWRVTARRTPPISACHLRIEELLGGRGQKLVGVALDFILMCVSTGYQVPRELSLWLLFVFI